jgi:hypothetical protein
MAEELQSIIPSSRPEILPAFAIHHLTRQFYREAQTRLEFQTHCQWYRATSAQNRQDLAKMRGELNIFQWFCRQR